MQTKHVLCLNVFHSYVRIIIFPMFQPFSFCSKAEVRGRKWSISNSSFSCVNILSINKNNNSVYSAQGTCIKRYLNYQVGTGVRLCPQFSDKYSLLRTQKYKRDQTLLYLDCALLDRAFDFYTLKK